MTLRLLNNSNPRVIYDVLPFLLLGETMENLIKFAEYRLAWECANAADVIVEHDGYFVILNKNDMIKLVNDNDIDVRIKVKEAARKAGYAVIPCNGRDEVIPTKKLIDKLYKMNAFDAIEILEQRG
jgi:hypothetical protein